ncbi:hypothetical protein [Sebaldella sp. S0638]|uniref:hypothetical protein n=1 Tax=Sebaldella sp. S0638 TaxID=2957809 RepID=UPI00209E5C58|nr:hypothetical protein [Sebaldella sp. S0638]MCP1226056.1 hypothetical protein [Sebaldella sp. S0638]
MKKSIIGMILFISVVSLSAEKERREIEILNVEAQMQKTDKMESYRSKKDIAWHKTEYNKVYKYLNKTKK